jgi:WD40 repeat protein
MQMLEQLKTEAEALAQSETQKRHLTRKNWLLTSGLLAAIAIGALASSWFSRQNAQIARQGEVETLVKLAEERFASHQQLEALETSIQALALLDKYNLQPEFYLKKLQPLLSNVQERNRWEAHKNGVLGLSVASVKSSSNNSETLIASSGRDGTLKLWNTKGELRQTLKQQQDPQDPIAATQFSRTGKFLSAVSRYGDISLWKMSDLTESFQLKREGAGYGLSISLDDNILAAPTERGVVKLWKTLRKNNVPLNTLPAMQFLPPKYQNKDYKIYGLEFSPVSRNLIVYAGEGDFSIWLWQPKPGINKPVLLGKHDNDITKVTFSPDGRQIASSSTDGHVKIWSVDSLQSTKLLIDLSASEKQIYTLKFSADGKFLATAGEDKAIRVWDINQAVRFYNSQSKGKPKDSLLAEMEGHQAPIYEIDFLSQQDSEKSIHHIISASNDGTLRIWNWQPINHDNESKLQSSLKKACLSVRNYTAQDSRTKTACNQY